MKPFTFAFAVVACTGLAFAQTPTTNGGSQRPDVEPTHKPWKPEYLKKKPGQNVQAPTGNLNVGVNGSDDCSTAPAVSGSGNLAFDNTGATTGAEGQHNGRQNNDIWWEWTASNTGDAVFSTCNDGTTAGNATYDTTITLWDGAGCPIDLAYAGYNDDGGGCAGFSSHLTHGVTAGSTYMIQMGGWGTGDFGTGVLEISNPGPPNGSDDCFGAPSVTGDLVIEFDNTTATTGAEGQHNGRQNNDIWWAWTADATGDATFSTCNDSGATAGDATYDTTITLWDGAGCPIDLAYAGYNDDGGGCAGFSSHLAAHPVTAGSTYMIQMGGWGTGDFGTGHLAISTAAAPPGTAGDDCSAPIVIAGNVDIAFDTNGATTDLAGAQDPRCNNAIWFEWTADADGNATFSTCNDSGATAGEATFDTKIHVYSAAGCPADGQASDAENDDGSGCAGFSSHLSGFPVTNGSTYMLQLGGWSAGEVGTGVLSCSISTLPPPANDDCATPDAISGQGSFAYDNSIATTGAEAQNDYLCYQFGSSNVDNDVWFAWTADVTGDATVDTCGSAPDTKLSAYDGSGCPAGASIACNDDTCGLQSSLTFPVVAGSTYTIQAGNFPGSAGGATTLNCAISSLPDHPYDECATAGVLVDGANFIDTTGASHGSNPATGSNASSCYTASSDVWHSYTASSSGLVIMAYCNLDGTPAADFDTVLSVYDSCGGTEIACNDDFCAFMSGLGFLATAGSTYMVNTGGWSGGEVGTGVLSVVSTLGVPYCNGSGGACPCGNDAAQILPSGCNNSAGSAASLVAVGTPSLGSDSVVLVAAGAVPNLPGVFFSGTNQVNGGAGVAFGDGLRCAGQNAVRIEVTASDGAGNAVSSVEVSTSGQAYSNTLSVGDVVNYQYWYREVATGGLCGNSHNLSNGLTFVWGA